MKMVVHREAPDGATTNPFLEEKETVGAMAAKNKPGPARMMLWGIILIFPVALLSSVEEQETPSPEESEKQPQLELEQTIIDAGRVDRGEQVEFTFVVRNTGEADLQILEVKSGCGCAVAEFDPVVPPGEEKSLTIRLKTRGMRGEVTKVGQVFTNDPDPQRKHVFLRMKAFVVAPIDVQPRESVMLRFKKGEAVLQEFQLSANAGPPLEIQTVQCSQPDIELEILPPEQIEGRQISRLRFQRPAQEPPTAFYAPIVVTTNNPQERRLVLRVQGQPQDSVFFLPQEMNFGAVAVPSSNPVRRVATLMRHEGTFRVLAATTDDPHLEIRVKEVRAGHYYTVTAVYQEGWEPGQKKGQIRVKTDDSETPELVVPFVALVRTVNTAPLRKESAAGH